MGRFIYEDSPKVEIEDRALTHIELVMTSKLRRGEPFTFSWKEDASVGGGRTTTQRKFHSSLASHASIGYVTLTADSQARAQMPERSYPVAIETETRL